MSETSSVFDKSDFLFDLVKHGDSRGFVSETFRRSWLENRGFNHDWVLEIHSYSAQRDTLRGMHFQVGQFAQAKLLRCIRGEIFDVLVDIRKNSPTFGQHVTFELTADQGQQLYIPRGFAHGFLTLSDHVELIYKCDAYYSKDHERGLAWNDAEVGIDWPLNGDPLLSDKDKTHPRLKNLETYFVQGDNKMSCSVADVTV